MDSAHLLIRKDHKRNLYLVEAAMGADRITLATALDYSEAFEIAQHLRVWTRRDPDNVPFPIYDKATQLA